jgi:hypothetical protein
MNKTGNLPFTLKKELVSTIIASFLKDEDVADSMMGLAIELTEPFINPENEDLFSEVSGMVAYALAQVFTGAAREDETLPDAFHVESAKKITEDGDKYGRRHLITAFWWYSTPQKKSYWQRRWEGGEPLSKGDIAQIERWINIAESQNHDT